ncbi:hypothetical protein AB0O20_06440 [Streptomyces kronopolitis]|uniref:hypothetical protein n=1 Tax=Streptomyces kronopolitis TaxID=1612435 RepID=UPI003421C6E8
MDHIENSAAEDAARNLRKIFDQLDAGIINVDDLHAANSAMDVAKVLGVTARDYERLLNPS